MRAWIEGDFKLLRNVAGPSQLFDVLKSPGEDWVLTADQMTLYVSLPQDNKVAVASTATWEK